MKAVEIKKKLIAQINLSNNDKLLEEFYGYLNLENELRQEYQLTNEMKSAVAEGREQIRNGNYLTDDQANNEIDQWLQE